MSAVPAQYQIKGVRPQDVKKTCSECKLPYTAHSGSRCGCCGDPIEHHTLDGFDECLAGRRRMARARFLAGVPLDRIDELVLENG